MEDKEKVIIIDISRERTKERDRLNYEALRSADF